MIKYHLLTVLAGLEIAIRNASSVLLVTNTFIALLVCYGIVAMQLWPIVFGVLALAAEAVILFLAGKDLSNP